MQRIGFLIPEFPSQTHAFFMREKDQLSKLGIKAELISTKLPQFGIAKHDWARKASKNTTYIYPMRLIDIISSMFDIILCGPTVWLKCGEIIFQRSNITFKERLKLSVMALAGSYIKIHCKREKLTHLHVHSCANSANIAMFSFILGGPSYSLTLHGPLRDYGNNQAFKWANSKFCIVITKSLLDEVKLLLEDTKLPPLFIAPMGVEVQNFERNGSYDLTGSSSLLKLVTCGRLNPCKAHDDLLRVVSILKNLGLKVRLEICGDVDSAGKSESYLKDLLNLIEELDIKDEVIFLGSVSENELKMILTHAHIFCLASLNEPLGVATMEAMSMELPVVVTKSPGVHELIDDNFDGLLVEPKRPEEFVQKILMLLNNQDLARTLAQNGRIKVTNQYNSSISAYKIRDGIKGLYTDSK